MPSADFFSNFGLFVIKDFLAENACADLRAAIRTSEQTPATVYDGVGDKFSVDEHVRRTQWADLPAEIVNALENKLDALRPKLEAHFKLPLTDRQRLQFLVYRTSDFFRAHRDNGEGDRGSAVAKARRVAVVIFLCSQSETVGEGRYGGGELTFYGLLNDPRAKNLGLPLVAEAGLLVAFPADRLHEVTPVTHGERFTVVSWFV
jgi:SM-20-related protein